MARSHLSVHLLHSPVQSGITVLLVHIVITSSTLITQPDAIVLDLGWVLLKNLVNGKHLTITLLDLLELSKKVPELGLGSNLIRGPQLHPVNLRMLIGLSWKSSPNNLILVKPESDHFRGNTRCDDLRSVTLSLSLSPGD